MRKQLAILVFLIITIVATPPPTPTTAQTEAVWYWATTPEGLVAYTADGQANLVYAGPDFYDTKYFAARLTNDTAILRGGDTFYRVTAETAQIIPLASSILRLRPYSYRHPYVVLMETETILPAAVLNVETLEVIGMAGELPNLPYFLADGTTLRYVGAELTNGQIVSSTLYQQNLVSSELIELMSIPINAQVINSSDGMYWWVMDETGTMQTIGDPDPQYTEWLQAGQAEVHGDWLWHQDPACNEDCTLDGYSLVDDTTFTLNLPDGMFNFPDTIGLFPDGSAIFIGTTDVRRMWLQNPDGTLLELGEVDYMNSVGDRFSADGQWAVAAGRTPEGDMTTRLWDLPKREIVFEAPFSDFTYHVFAGDTVALYYDSQARTLYWNGNAFRLDLYTSTLYQYPDNFFEVLSGGQALYEAPDGGIYRFDAATESMTLLVPGGKYISVYDLR